MVGIYKITNIINKKIYIGQSVNIEHRGKQEFNDAYNINKIQKYNSELSKDIRLYGGNNFKKEVIEQCAQEQLNDKETHGINYYNSLKPNGYNSALIGHQIVERITDVLYNYHKEIKELIKYSNLSLLEISTKYEVGLSTIEDINQGRTWVDESEIYPLRIGNRRGRVAQLSCGQVLKIYDSVQEAHKQTGLDNSSISKVCKGQRKTCGGYQGMWVD